MKKKLIIIISLVGIMTLIGICFIFRDDLLKFKRNIYPIHSVMKSEENENEIHNEEITNNKNSEEKIEEVITENKQEEKIISKNETVKINSNESSISSKKNEQASKNNTTSTSNNNNSGESNSNVTPKQEEKPVVVQKQPWEELGLTEDQYKNQPMYSWEEVDFKTKEECMNYGNEHAEYGFECSEVTSWTRSLGWDYKTF